MHLDLITLTDFEELGLSHRYNLADGRARQEQSESQIQIIGNLSDLFFEAERGQQNILETDFKNSFFTCGGQTSVSDGQLTLLSHSASIAIEIVANCLKKHGLTVTLIHPTFDNIAAILRRVGIPLKPLEDNQLADGRIEECLARIETKAIFLVFPNNPTGWTPSEEEFKDIVEYCKRTRKLLVIDFSFRFFSPLVFWDQYRLMLDADIEFLTVEDTGKSWPTLDLKAGITTASKTFYADIHRIHSDVLLNISPFQLKLLQKYIEDTQRNGLGASIISASETNRQVLAEGLIGTILEPLGTKNIGTEWLHITNKMTAMQIWAFLRSNGIFVLPGNQFFWNDERMGDSYIRVALMRPVKMFRDAVEVMRSAIIELMSKTL